MREKNRPRHETFLFQRINRTWLPDPEPFHWRSRKCSAARLYLPSVIPSGATSGTVFAAAHSYSSQDGAARLEKLAKIDRALDELLVSLGGMVLRLANPEISRTVEERQALVRSVNPYSAYACCSTDPRVQRLNNDLLRTLRPRLRLVSSK